ncbi:hypothetical protein BMT54_08030 [Pasteurellaceae bacterium 15-036681]|nr:hypothetical protein BMT54_08030 [Pasteurellaceae bacterium 15-036681]
MLTHVEVTNFKSFKDTLVFDLTKSKSYEFNAECVKNGVIQKAIVYGMNGSGKSNLGLTIFDLIGHTTNKHSGVHLYKPNYAYAGSSKDTLVKFKYEFIFENVKLEYSYTKLDYDYLISEELSIDNKVYLSIDRSKNNIAKIEFSGTDSLNKRIDNDKLSIISYLRSNANLDKRNKVNKIFYAFLNFLDGMLYFRNLQSNDFVGYSNSKPELISVGIVRKDKVSAFEEFLNSVGIECQLGTKDNDLYWIINETWIPFFDICSSGTEALACFYYWYICLEDNNVSFLFIDEFDAFYHHELSKKVVELLKPYQLQLILTTHSTSIMTNDLLRPDCYFVLHQQKLLSLPYLTDKELRQAHNLEKLYRASAFMGD